MFSDAQDVLFQKRLYQRLEHVVGRIENFPESMVAEGRETSQDAYAGLSFTKLHDDRDRVVLRFSQSIGEKGEEQDVAFFLIDTAQKKAQAAPRLAYFKDPQSLELKSLESVRNERKSFLEEAIADGFSYGKKDRFTIPLTQIGVDPRVMDVPVLQSHQRFGRFCNVYGEKLLRGIYEHGYRFQGVDQQRRVAPELTLNNPDSNAQREKPMFQVINHRAFDKGEIIEIQLSDGRKAQIIANDLKPGERAKDVLRDMLSPSMRIELAKSVPHSGEEVSRQQEQGKHTRSSQQSHKPSR